MLALLWPALWPAICIAICCPLLAPPPLHTPTPKSIDTKRTTTCQT